MGAPEHTSTTKARMKMKCLLVGITIAAVAVGTTNDSPRFVPLAQLAPEFWESDSLFLGAGLEVADSVHDVLVTWRPADSRTLYAVYFMVPGYRDSARFLFHNKHQDFANESTTVNLGHFGVGTELVLMSCVVDTAQEWARIFGKKLYSGENRVELGNYVSQWKGAVSYKWAVAGRILGNACEMSFDNPIPGGFREARFIVTNAILKR